MKQKQAVLGFIFIAYLVALVIGTEIYGILHDWSFPKTIGVILIGAVLSQIPIILWMFVKFNFRGGRNGGI